MLKQRILTAIILLPGVIAALLFLTSLQFAFLSAALILIATTEWLNLMAVEKTIWQVAYLILMTCALTFSLVASPLSLLIVAVLWWLLAIIWIFLYPKHQQVWARTPILAILGLEILMPFWFSLNLLRVFSLHTLIFVLMLVWITDTGAYAAGKLFGRHKLLPAVSPGKTIEGVVGGVTAAILFALVVSHWYHLESHKKTALWIGLVIGTVLMSIIGDLLESMVKRHRGVKDSGRILPGHGGILDRIDSLTAALPFYSLGVIYLKLPALVIHF